MSDTTTVDSLPQIAVEAAYGRAMLAAHALELKLSTLLILRLSGVQSDERRRDIQIANIKRLTLGPLIGRFVAEYEASGYLQEELDNMLYFRNSLAHRISETVLGEALDPGWCLRVVTELSDIESYFRETNGLLECYVDEWLHANGYKKEKLFSIGKAIYKGLGSG